MNVPPAGRLAALLALALLASAPSLPLMSAAGSGVPEDPCAPPPPQVAGGFAPGILVVVDQVCIATADATAGAASPADGCTSEAYALGRHKWTGPLVAKVDARGSGLAAADLVAAFSTAANAWDDAAAADLFGSAAAGGDGARVGTRDGVNQVGFRSLGTTGVVGRTTTWFTSDGRALESDIAFNTDYAWALGAASGKADFQSVATHELGHAFGLEHAPQTSANTCLTMYPSTRMGSTAQRTLGTGDRLGIEAKYGAAPAPAPVPAPSPAPFAVTFKPKAGNEWWVEVNVDANRPLAGVTAQVAGSAPVALAKTNWGSWAKSFHVPTGSLLRFTASSTDGATAASSQYVWPSAAPAPDTSPFEASFTKHSANAWWVEVRVEANAPLAAVAVSIDGGAPVALAKTSWGTWARSFHVPEGSTAVFTATSDAGAKATSAPMAWP